MSLQAATAPTMYLESYVPVVKYHGLNTALPVQLTPTVTGTPANAATENEGLRQDATLSQTSGNGVAGGVFVTTTAGSAGAWGNGIYAEIIEGTAGSATQFTTGYVTAGEFQTTLRGSWTDITWACLTLNANDDRVGPAATAGSYFLIRDYGTIALAQLFNFFDAVSVGNAASGKLVVSSADKAATHMVRFTATGVAQLWFLATTNAPS